MHTTNLNSTLSPPILSFSQSAVPSFSHYTHSPFPSLPLPLLPILHHFSLTNNPIPHFSHPHSKTHKIPHFLHPPIQLPLSNLLYPPSNTHSTITTHLLPITKLPISPTPALSHKPTTPFLSQSPIHLYLSPKKATHALPSQHFTTPLNSKESKAMHLYNLTIHKPSVVQRSIYGWRRLCCCDGHRQLQLAEDGGVYHFERKHHRAVETGRKRKRQRDLQLRGIRSHPVAQALPSVRYNPIHFNNA